MQLKRHLAGSVLWLAVWSFQGAHANDKPQSSDPELRSHHPLGGSIGTPFEIRVRGKRLPGTHTVWFECDDVQARVLAVKEIAETGELDEDQYYRKRTLALLGQDGQEPEFLAVLEVLTSPDTRPGLHHFRLVGPTGLSNSLSLHLVDQPLQNEEKSPHHRPSQAQELRLPAIVNGTIEDKGELDYYSFEVEAGETLAFQVLSGFELGVNYWAQTEIRLYEPHQSWFGTDRARPLVLKGPRLSWEPIRVRSSWFDRRDFVTQFVLHPLLEHRFEKAGRYLLSVGTFLGRSRDNGYQLRVGPARNETVSRRVIGGFGQPAHADPADWLERDSSTLRQFGSFYRRLGDDRLAELRTRSVAASSSGSDTSPPMSSIRDHEPNDTAEAAQELTLPGFAEGRIDFPGDVDRFRFRVTAGQALALEVETPRLAPPHFSPWLKVLDTQGEVVAHNIYREYGGNGIDPNKTIERKTLHTFEEEGDYWLLVRDLTDHAWGDEFQYRVLIRPQVPHVGRMEFSLGVFSVSSQLIEITDRLNLKPGESRSLTLVADLEEGFDGGILVEVDGLPDGIQVQAATPASWSALLIQGIQYRPPGEHIVDPKTHRPKRQAVTLLLRADSEVQPTSLPRFLRIRARPMSENRTGPPIIAGRIPLLILDSPENTVAITDPQEVALAP